MTRTLAIIALSFSVSCAKHNANYSVPSEVEPYIKTFESLSQRTNKPIYINDLIVVFKKLDWTMLGKCTWGGDTTPVMELNSDRWSSLSAPVREQLVFHELGHCILGRNHKDDTVIATDVSSIKINASVMSTYHFGEYSYTINRNAYMEELFFGFTQAPYVFRGMNQFPYAIYAPAPVQASSRMPASDSVMTYASTEQADVNIPYSNSELTTEIMTGAEGCNKPFQLHKLIYSIRSKYCIKNGSVHDFALLGICAYASIITYKRGVGEKSNPIKYAFSYSLRKRKLYCHHSF